MANEQTLDRKMKILVPVVTSVLLSSCGFLSPVFSGGHDPQFLRVYYRNGRDILDTFHGTYQKDLVEAGTIKVPMWLTTREQQILLMQLGNSFFSLPDTIYAQPGAVYFPNSGPEVLTVEYKGRTKTVVWYWPVPVTNNPFHDVGRTILNIRLVLWDIIHSKPEYKALPPAKGGYY